MDWGCRRPACVLLAYKSPQRHEPPRRPHRRPWFGIFLIDAIHTNLRNGDGTQLWNVGDSTLTTMKMAHMVKADAAPDYGLSPRKRSASATASPTQPSELNTVATPAPSEPNSANTAAEFIAAPKGRPSHPVGPWCVNTWKRLATPAAPGLYCHPSGSKPFWATSPLPPMRLQPPRRHRFFAV